MKKKREGVQGFRGSGVKKGIRIVRKNNFSLSLNP
jgi:hypothetical protein